MRNEIHNDLRACAKRALSAGQMVVVFAGCDGGIDRARSAARRLGDWLTPLGPFAAGGLSRSATRGLAAVAACRKGSVGVDVERVDGTILYQDEATSFMHPSEWALCTAAANAGQALAVWTRKEAALKAFGTGLAVAPDSLWVGIHDSTWTPIDHPLLGAAHVISLLAPIGFVAAAAARTSPAPSICLIEAGPGLLRDR